MPFNEQNGNIFTGKYGVFDLAMILIVAGGIYGLTIGWVIFSPNVFIDSKIIYKNKVIFHKP